MFLVVCHIQISFLMIMMLYSNFFKIFHNDDASCSDSDDGAKNVFPVWTKIVEDHNFPWDDDNELFSMITKNHRRWWWRLWRWHYCWKIRTSWWPTSLNFKTFLVLDDDNELFSMMTKNNRRWWWWLWTWYYWWQIRTSWRPTSLKPFLNAGSARHLLGKMKMHISKHYKFEIGNAIKSDERRRTAKTNTKKKLKKVKI